MQKTEQEALADRLPTHDEQALEEILRACGPAVMGVLKRRYVGVLGEADIEDAISVGLYRLWKTEIDSIRSNVLCCGKSKASRQHHIAYSIRSPVATGNPASPEPSHKRRTSCSRCSG